MKTPRILLSIVLVLTFLNSCVQYRIDEFKSASAQKIANKRTTTIIHHKGEYWKLTDSKFNKESNTVSGKKTRLSKDEEAIYQMALHGDLKVQLHIFDENIVINDSVVSLKNVQKDSLVFIKNEKIKFVDSKVFSKYVIDLIVVHDSKNIWKGSYDFNKDDFNEIILSKPSRFEMLYIKKKLTFFPLESKLYHDLAIADSLINYSSTPEKNIVFKHQIHAHLDTLESFKDSIRFNASNINKIDLVKRKKHEGIALGVTLSTITISAGIGAAIFFTTISICGCPHNYVYNGEEYVYTNTLFTGAAHSKIERNDYKIIPDFDPNSTQIKMNVKNEMDEEQYTNLMELWVVEHSENERIIPDQNGNLHVVSKETSPSKIINGSGMNLSLFTEYKDEYSYPFNDISDNDYSEVILEYPITSKDDKPNLILSLKNTKWSKFVFDQFSEQFGDMHEKWKNKKRKQSKEKIENSVKKSGLTMTVEIKTENEWQEIEVINLQGDVSFNEIAIPINQKLIKGNTVEIKLKSGFKFWELDYASLSSATKKKPKVQKIKAVSPDRGVSLNLSEDDNLYMKHLNKGDSSIVVFKGIEKKGNKRTLILRSKGYYLGTKTYEGKPNIPLLMRINRSGGLSWFSNFLFNMVIAENKADY